MSLTRNQKAMLDCIAWAEGTSTSKATKNNGYDVIVTGFDGKPEIFVDYSTHPFANGRPSKKINSKGLTSNASGRYQHMLRDWLYYKNMLRLPDFSPVSQDAWAVQLMKERRALPLIEAGKFEEAIGLIRNLWASLPGAGYKDQPMRSMADLKAVYVKAGGTLA